jgi:hypothetical protein
LALLLGFRTLEQFGCARSQGNEALQRRSEISLALLMLLDAQRDLGLPLFQLARFFVVFVLRNTLVEPQVEQHSEPVTKLIVLASQAFDGVLMKSVLGLVPGLHVREQGIQQFGRDLDRS